MILLEIQADDPRAEILRAQGFPFVMVGHRTDNAGISFVDLDIEHGIGLALEHLVALGHREIAFLAIAPVVRQKVYGFATWALQGYEHACARFGLAPISASGSASSDAMSAAASRLLDDHPEVTAMIAPQELSAVGVLRACSCAGPDDPARSLGDRHDRGLDERAGDAAVDDDRLPGRGARSDGGPESRGPSRQRRRHRAPGLHPARAHRPRNDRSARGTLTGSGRRRQRRLDHVDQFGNDTGRSLARIRRFVSPVPVGF